MKITSVSVQIGTTVTKNYNSVRNEVGFAADLAEADDPDECVRQLQRKCQQLLLAHINSNDENATERRS